MDSIISQNSKFRGPVDHKKIWSGNPGPHKGAHPVLAGKRIQPINTEAESTMAAFILLNKLLVCGSCGIFFFVPPFLSSMEGGSLGPNVSSFNLPLASPLGGLKCVINLNFSLCSKERLIIKKKDYFNLSKWTSVYITTKLSSDGYERDEVYTSFPWCHNPQLYHWVWKVLLSRGVASITVPGGQEFHFLHFSSNLNHFFLIFPLSSFFCPHFGPPGRRLPHKGPGYTTAFIMFELIEEWEETWYQGKY